jgi:pimeloyl-ACP methyl ester carboxylesterase
VPTERLLTAGGVRARALEEGAGDAVVLVHGAAAWAENWMLTMPALAGAGYRAIALDLPGFGKSERARSPRYFDHPDAYYVRFLREAMDALELEAAHLVGHSMGGAVAAIAAAALPERFRSLALAAPGAFGTTLPLSFRLASLRIAGLFARFAPAALVRSSVNACFADPGCVPDWLYEHAHRYARAGGAAEFARLMHYGVTLRGVRPELRDRWEDAIRAIRIPTLVVWGREDVIVPLTHLVEVRARLPHARVALIERAGHLVQIERPDEFNAALLAFLGSCRGSSSATVPPARAG